MQTTTVPYYSHHPGPPPNHSQPPIGTGATTSVSHAPNSSAAGVATTTGGGGGDPVALRVSVAHLLSRAYTVPCSAAALAFTQLVQPIARFQLALDVLLPLFLDSTVPLQQRILVSYILYSLYAPHPIAINPFKSVLLNTFLKEKDKAVASTVINPSAPSSPTSPTGSGKRPSENEQFVWVLWKILRGDGSDIGPFTPSNLARSPVPPKLRPEYLTLEDEDSLVKFDPFGDSSPPTPASDPSKQRPPQFSPVLTSVSSSIKAKDGETDIKSVTLLNREKERERDLENERVAEGMRLLLASRDRVLTLAEQRMLTPLIPTLTSSPTIVTSLDLGGMIANNTTIAYLVVVSLLSHPPLQTNPANGTIRSTSIGGKANGEEESHLESIVGYLEVLRHLPPTLPSFDLMGRLLKDGRVIPDYSGGGTNLELSGGSDYMGSTRTGSGGGCDEGGNTTIADLISLEVLGWFIHSCVEWLGRWEEEERTGGRFDGGFGIGVRNLCRFYTSLIKQSIIDPSSDADTAEMKHFTLRNARMEDANRLYRLLVYPLGGVGGSGSGGAFGGSSGVGAPGVGIGIGIGGGERMGG